MCTQFFKKSTSFMKECQMCMYYSNSKLYIPYLFGTIFAAYPSLSSVEWAVVILNNFKCMQNRKVEYWKKNTGVLIRFSSYRINRSFHTELCKSLDWPSQHIKVDMYVFVHSSVLLMIRSILSPPDQLPLLSLFGMNFFFVKLGREGINQQ